MSISYNGLSKRRTALMVAVLILLTALIGTVAPRRSEAAKPVFTVYLQAGHSPSVYGSGNITSGIKESVLNEQVTIKTYHALKNAGVNVKLLNPLTLDTTLPSVIKGPPGETDQYAYYSPEPAMLTALTSPGQFDAEETRQADLVLALHHNAYSNTSISGYEIYYANTYGGNYGRTQQDAANSKQAAECIGYQFRTKGFYVPERENAVRSNSSNNGITKNAPMAAVLVEVGYMTNPSDLAACRSSSNQDVLAQRLTDAVIDYRDHYWTPDDVITFTQNNTSVTFSEQTETIKIDTTVQPANAVARVRASVWPASAGESAAKWYTFADQGNGRYTANISIADFEYVAGEYNVNLFVADATGDQQKLSEAHPVVTGGDRTPPTAKEITAKTLSPKSNAAVLRATGVEDPAGVKNVRFCVWSEEGEKDDVQWYDAVRSENGSEWAATMTTTNHRDRTGNYIVEAYATDMRSNEGLMGTTNVVFNHRDGSHPELYGELLYKTQGNRLVVTATDVRDPAGVRGVRVALWSTSLDQKDIEWHKAVRRGSDWTAVIDLSKHTSANGRYSMQVYATDENGNDGQIATLTFRIGGDTVAPTARSLTVKEGKSGTATLILEGLSDDKNEVVGADFFVWSEKSGEQESKQYQASKQEDGTWISEVNAADLNNYKGPYNVQAYATDAASNRGYVASTTFTFGVEDIQPPSARAVTADQTDYTGQLAKITVEGVSDDSGIERVWLVVSPKAAGSGVAGNTNSDVEQTLQARYEATCEEGSTDNWSASFNWASDFSEAGTYNIAAYAEDWSGKRACVGTTSVTVATSAVAGYKIMGTSNVTVAQLVNAQLQYGWSNSWYGGMTVLEFCQMYYDICEQEGVKAEVAYAQMLHETAGLRYGNLVTREQNNFAGLGSSGNVVAASSRKATHRYTESGKDAGIMFTSVENGIKSHIQHLKGYASTQAFVLSMAPEYDRAGYMVRGCAPTLQLLSQKWATDPAYGDSIYRYVETIKTMSTTMPDITAIPEPPADKPNIDGSSSEPTTTEPVTVPDEMVTVDEPTDEAIEAAPPVIADPTQAPQEQAPQEKEGLQEDVQ